MNSVIVRVWVSLLKARSPGHASLALSPDAKTPHDGYISFAPVEQGSISGPGKFYTWDHDREHYANRGVWVGRIYGLHVHKMVHAFMHARQHSHHYSPFNECASQVHRYLKIGGADKLASFWSRNVLVTWSPDDVEDYARSIIHHTQNLGSRGHKYVGEGTLFPS